MKRTVFTIIIIIGCIGISFGQSSTFHPINPTFGFSKNKQTLTTPKTSVSMGSSFFTGFNGASVLGTNISTNTLFPVKPKFQIETGISYQTYFIRSGNASVGEGQNQKNANNISLGTIYLSGIYELNPKVTLRGTTWKQFDLSSPKTTLNPRSLDFNAEGVNFGINYKVNDHFQFDASFEYSNGYNPNRMQHFGGSMYNAYPFSGF